MRDIHVEEWGNVNKEVQGMGADYSNIESAVKGKTLLQRGTELLTDNFVLPGQIDSEERARDIVAKQTVNWLDLLNNPIFDKNTLVDSLVKPDESLDDLNEAMREAKDRTILLEKYNEDMAFDPVRASEKYKNVNVFSSWPTQNWTQKNMPFIEAQNNRGGQPAQSPFTAQLQPGSDISSRAALFSQISAKAPPPQATGFTLRSGGITTASTKLKGFGGNMQEKEYMDLNKALTAMDKEYRSQRINRRGPNKAFIEKAYQEGSDFVVDEAQVDFYPDATKLSVTQIKDSAPSTTSIPDMPNALPNTQQLVDSANAVKDYAVDAYVESLPVAGSLSAKFNALDTTSKVMLIGGAVLAAKYAGPSIIAQLPTKLLYLGAAAILFSQMKPAQGV